MSGLLDSIVRRRRASASSRLGPPSENGTPYVNGVSYGGDPVEPTGHVNGSAPTAGEMNGLPATARTPPAESVAAGEPAAAIEPLDAVYVPDLDATQEFGVLAPEATEPEAVAEAVPVRDEPAPLQPPAIGAAAEIELAPDPEREAQPVSRKPGRIRSRLRSPRRHEPLPVPEPDVPADEPAPLEPVTAPAESSVVEPAVAEAAVVEAAVAEAAVVEPAVAEPDTVPEPKPEVVDETEVEPEPRFRERGRMRRRARYLRRLREVQLRDIGGLVLELHRFDRDRPDLVLAKVAGAAQTDRELRALERALDEQQPFRELREAGIGGACEQCGAVHGTTDRFCAACGESLLEPEPEFEGDAQ